MPDYVNFEKHLAETLKTVYPESQEQYHEKMIDAAMTQFLNDKIKDVLDVGYGTGYSLNKFREKGFNVTGISLCDQEIQAMNFIGHKVKKMDMNFLEFPDASFDLLWCRHVLEHSVMPYIALSEFKRVLRKCGYIYIEVPSDSGIHVQNKNHYSLFSDQMWQALYRRIGFRLLFRGQFSVSYPDIENDLYWQYWLKYET